jgi:hypothetical protein
MRYTNGNCPFVTSWLCLPFPISKLHIKRDILLDRGSKRTSALRAPAVQKLQMFERQQEQIKALREAGDEMKRESGIGPKR